MHQDVRFQRRPTAVGVYEVDGGFRLTKMMQKQRDLRSRGSARAWVLHIFISLGLVKNEYKRQHAKRSSAACLHILSQSQSMAEPVKINKHTLFTPNVSHSKSLQG